MNALSGALQRGAKCTRGECLYGPKAWLRVLVINSKIAIKASRHAAGDAELSGRSLCSLRYRHNFPRPQAKLRGITQRKEEKQNINLSSPPL